MVFFQIDNPDAFRRQLKLLIPLVTTATQAAGVKEQIKQHKLARRVGLMPVAALNIAFSQFGLNKVSPATLTREPLQSS